MSGTTVRPPAGAVLVTGSGSPLGGMVARTLRAAGHDVLHAPAGLADNPELRGALRGASRVFLEGTGTDAHQTIEMLADAGSPSVVVLSDAVAELAAEFDVSGYRQLEAAVRASGLRCSILRPTDLSANALRWASQFAWGSTVAAPYLDAYQEPVDEQDVADAAVALLTDERHHGRTYRLSGPHSLTRRELIAILAAAAGRPAEAVPQPPEQWQAAAQAAGIPAPAAAARLATWQAAVGRPGRTDATISAVTGAEPRTFTAWARAHRAEFALNQK